MLIITHAVTGAVIGQLTGNSALSFVTSVTAHFIMDMIPHGDSGEYERYRASGKITKSQIFQNIFDVVIVIGFTVYLLAFHIEANWWPIFWGILGGVLPDLLVGVHECKPSRATKYIHQLHFFFHDVIIKKWRDVKYRYSIILQILGMIIVMGLVF